MFVNTVGLFSSGLLTSYSEAIVGVHNNFILQSHPLFSRFARCEGLKWKCISQRFKL